MKSAVPRPPRIYFSFRSPYSWLAFHDLTKQHPSLAAALEWRPFWEPDADSERRLRGAGGDFIYTPMSREKHLYILRDVRRLVAQRGLQIKWPVDRNPCWEVSHLAYFVAAEEGLALPFIAGVYRARWEQGRDISERATIAEVASEVGVSRRAADAVGDERWRAAGAQTLLSIYEDGVFGVPYFIHKSEKFWGVERLEAFVQCVAGTVPHAEERPEPPHAATDAHASDWGHAGGCG